MGNMKEYLRIIKSAIFGKDMRGAIHDAINEMHNETSQNTIRQDLLEKKYDEQIKNIAGSEVQSAEVVDARCGFDTLGSVIKQKVYHFENVEKMKNCLTLLPGDVCETSGYYEANDGGGARYVIRIKKSEDIEDYGTIHFISDLLVAELINYDEYGRFNVKQFGVKGDGVTDDYEKLNYVLNLGKENTYIIPNGEYLISQTIYIESLCNIEMGNNAILKASAEMTDLIIYNDSKTLGQAVGKHITGGILNGNHKVNNVLTLGNYAGFSIKDIGIRNFKSKGLVTKSTNSTQATGIKGDNISIRNYDKTYLNTYGIYASGGDAKYRNITTVDVQTGIYNEQYCIFEIFHAWLSSVGINTPGLWEKSLVAHNKSSYGRFISCTVDTVRTGFHSENCDTKIDNCLVIANDLFYTKELASNFPCIFAKSTNGYVIANNCSGYLNYGKNIINTSANSRNKFMNCKFGANSSNGASWDTTNYNDYYDVNSQLGIYAGTNNPNFNDLKLKNKFYKVSSIGSAVNNPCKLTGLLECITTGAINSRVTIQRYTPFEKPNITYQRIYQETTNGWTEWYIINQENDVNMTINSNDLITINTDSYCKKQGNQVTLHLDFTSKSEITAWTKFVMILEKPTTNLYCMGLVYSGTEQTYNMQVYADGGVVSGKVIPANTRVILDLVYFV